MRQPSQILWQETLRNHPRGVVVNTAATAGVLFILAEPDSFWLWIWGGCSLIYSVARLGMYRVCMAHLDAPLSSPRQRFLLRQHQLGIVGAGLFWAVLAWWGLPYFAGSQQYAILVVLSALAGGATGTLAGQRVVGKVYVLLMILPACVQMLRLGGGELVSLAVLGFIFAWVMVSSHDNNHGLMLRAVSLASDNAELVRDLSNKAQEIERANVELERRVADRTRELHHLAHHDMLTGILNRRGVLALAQQMADAHPRLKLSVLFVDLDRFKHINDTLGHEWGDRALCLVAQRLTASGRTLADALPAERHLVGRWGGDEFVLAIVHDAETDLPPYAEAFQRSLATPYQALGRELHLGASIGCATTCTAAHQDLLATLADADLAAAQAKRLGRNRLVLVDDTLLALQRRRTLLATALRSAHSDGSLRLLFQPIVCADTSRVVAFEALLRWRCAGLGDVSPAEFIPLAEECDLIAQLGQWVLEHGCRRAADWPPEIKLAINTSIKQLVLPDFVERVRQTLSQSGCAASRLVVEVTESVFDESNTHQALNSLLALRGLGVEVHIDDFGTGYSSLSRLREFPLDAVKIDRSFVLAGDSRSAAVIKGTLLIAHNFGLRVIAEGVETRQQADMLASLGVDELQGYHFGRPSESVATERAGTPSLSNS